MRFRTAFRIFYSTSYYVLYIVLLVLCLVTPADLVRQAYARDNHQFYNIIVVCGAVGLTLCLALLIGITRWKTNSNVLKSIPKQCIPIEKDDVNRSVRKMIVASLSRSAAIAWDARPRVDPQPPTIVSGPDTRDAIARPPEPGEVKKKGRGFSRKRTGRTETEEPVIAIPSYKPVWGDISHNGWSSPVSPDLPNLQYVSVVLELPHLIEAKAVSLAPPDPDSNSDPPMPDIQVVELLQRPAAMGLRDYIGHLINIGIITSIDIATDFLNAYERARFSAQPLSEKEFRDLMKQFAELLRGMNSLDAKEFELNPPESDIDDDGSSSLTPATQRSRSIASSRSTTSRSPSEGTIRTAPSRRPGTKNTNRTTEFGTAPATPRSRKTSRAISRSPSSHSFSQTRRPYTSNSGTLSDSLDSQGSVIKLSRTNESGDLPYTLTVPGASTQKTYSWESRPS